MRPALVPLVLLAFLAPAADAKAELGTPTVGDHWEVRSTAAGQQVTARSNLTALEPITIDGTTHQAARLESHSERSFAVAGFTTTTVTDTTTWVRVSDGASLRTTVRTTSPPPFPGAPSTGSTSETTYSPPCIYDEFPLFVGKTWSSSCHSTTTTTYDSGGPANSQSFNASTAFRVVREESVTVPAGTFQTLVVESNSTSNGTSFVSYHWYAPRACNSVRSASDIDGMSISSELVSFRCASTGAYTPGEGNVATSTPATPSESPAAGTASPPVSQPTIGQPTTAPTPGLPGPGLLLSLAAVGLAVLAFARRP